MAQAPIVIMTAMTRFHKHINGCLSEKTRELSSSLVKRATNMIYLFCPGLMRHGSEVSERESCKQIKSDENTLKNSGCSSCLNSRTVWESGKVPRSLCDVYATNFGKHVSISLLVSPSIETKGFVIRSGHFPTIFPSKTKLPTQRTLEQRSAHAKGARS